MGHHRTEGRGVIARLLPGVRERFVALLLVAAIPLFAMASVISVQYARAVADQTRQRAVLAREAVKARHEALVADGNRLLAGLVLVPELQHMQPDRCSAILQSVMQIPGDRYANISVLDQAGMLRCAGRLPPGGGFMLGANFAAEPAFQATRISGRFEASAPHRSLVSGVPVIPIALALPGDGAFRGALLAGLRVDRLVVPNVDGPPDGEASWVVDEHGGVLPLAGPTDAARPTPAGLASLLAAPTRIRALTGHDGATYVYAVADLPGALRVVIAARATGDLLQAAAELDRRLIGLSLLLLAGLGAMALGAHAAIARPLKRLAEAVARWRAGGRFEPGPLHGAPAEVRELARSFVEATTALETREKQLAAAAGQQELLMQEIHHRVKNNLQIVASLLNLQASRIRLPEARSAFEAARDRIRALATLHRHLYAHGELHTINMRGFLEELCQQLLQAMGEPLTGGRIALSIEATELQISSDQAVPIALIVTEVVSNAVKYAFPGGRRGHISVRLAVGQDERGRPTARLTIDDDGIGIPSGRIDGGRIDPEEGAKAGIGLQLVRGFARQLGAEMRVTGNPGTHYELQIQLHQQRCDPGPAKAGGEPPAAAGERQPVEQAAE